MLQFVYDIQVLYLDLGIQRWMLKLIGIFIIPGPHIKPAQTYWLQNLNPISSKLRRT